MNQRLRTLAPYLLITLLGLLTYWGSPISVSTDSKQVLRILLSMRDQTNTDLNEFYPNGFPQDERYQFVCTEGQRTTWLAASPITCPATAHLYSFYPPLSNLIYYPFFRVLDAFASVTPALPIPGSSESFWTMLRGRHYVADLFFFERLLASLVAIASGLLLYAAACALAGPRLAFVVALVYLFATTTYSTASRALWTHTTGLLLTCAMLVMLAVFPRREWAQSIALTCAVLCVFNRPSTIVILPALALLLFWPISLGTLRKAWILVLPAITGIALLVYHQRVFGDPLPPYYRLGSRLSIEYLTEAAAGHLISPSRGLFVYSPILLLAAYGMLLTVRKYKENGVLLMCSGVALLHYTLISFYPEWWAGHCYGPRYMTDIAPFLCLLLIPALQAFGTWSSPKKQAAYALCVVLAAVSFWMHSRPAVLEAPNYWSGRGGNVDYPEHHMRLWNWKQAQFLARDER